MIARRPAVGQGGGVGAKNALIWACRRRTVLGPAWHFCFPNKTGTVSSSSVERRTLAVTPVVRTLVVDVT